jgi:hypothetical protein
MLSNLFSAPIFGLVCFLFCLTYLPIFWETGMFKRLRKFTLLALGFGAIASSVTLTSQNAAGADAGPEPGALRGKVIANLAQTSDAPEIRIPGANVVVTATSAEATSIATKANVYGDFLVSGLAAGDYDVCAHVPGYNQTCLRAAIKPGPAGPKLAVALAPVPPYLWGKASLQDGAPSVRMATSTGTSGASQVSLEDLNGQLFAGPVSVNLDGYYVLPMARTGQNLAVVARYERNLTRQLIDVGAPGLEAVSPVNLTFPTSNPILTGIDVKPETGSESLTAVTAGHTIALTAKANSPTGETLRYRWTPSDGSVGAEDTPTFTWRTPDVDGPVTVAVEVTDGKGGFARGSVALSPNARTGDSPHTNHISVISLLSLSSVNLLEGACSNVPNCALLNLVTFVACCNFIDPLVTEYLAGCSNLDDLRGYCQTALQKEANTYYQTIGVYQPGTTQPTAGLGGRGSLAGWKFQNNFPGNENTAPGLQAGGVVRAVYYNAHDLGLGRDMNCRDNSTPSEVWVACYVTNYANTGAAGGQNEASVNYGGVEPDCADRDRGDGIPPASFDHQSARHVFHLRQ